MAGSRVKGSTATANSRRSSATSEIGRVIDIGDEAGLLGMPAEQ